MFSEIGFTEWLMLMVRYAHIVGAVAWLGGSIFHAAALRPLVLAAPAQMQPAMSLIGPAYREIVDISIVALIVSGLLMMFYRIQGDGATVAWAAVLAVKIAIALVMFYIVWRNRRSGGYDTGKSNFASRMLGYDALLAMGMIVFMLASVMSKLVETTLG